MELNKIYNECCLETMGRMDENSVDTIITDPPYGLRFMGKKWDYDVPNSTVWRACLDVLKPGGTMLVFAGSRTQHRMAVAIEDAGFILKDCIMYLYGSGFPKATDISKQLDKGVERENGKLRTDGRGKNQLKIDNQEKGCTGIGHMDGSKQKYYETLPATPEAQLWNGWKSHGLKPAYEPILVCMKPNDGSYAENALKHGVSGLNIDGGRIEHNEPEVVTNRQKDMGNSWNNGNCGIRNNPSSVASANPQGRFPANVIFDEEAGKMLDEQTGTLKSGKNVNPTTKGSQTAFFGNGQEYYNQETYYGDKGGASRFFYCAKASKAERNMGLTGHVSHVSHDGRDKFIENPYQRHENKQINHHPTVKPLKLMEYLCTLTKTPTGGIVFDPFMGSGTTGIACKNTGREFIGCEIDKEYFKIAEKRIRNEKAQGRFHLNV